MKKTYKILGGIFLISLIFSTFVLGGSVTLDDGTDSLVEYDDMDDLAADQTLTINWSNDFAGYDGNSTAEVVIAVYVPVDYGIMINNVTINDTRFQIYNVSAGNCTGLNELAGDDIWHTNCTLITINGTLQNPSAGFNLNIDIDLSSDCYGGGCDNKTYELMFSDLITYKKEVNYLDSCDLGTYNYTANTTYCYKVDNNINYSCVVSGQQSNPAGLSCNITKGIGNMTNSSNIMEQGTTGKVVTVPYVSYTIELVEGWNLISLPVIPNNLSIDSVLSNVDYKTLWRWNATGDKWESYTAAIQFGDFDTFEPDRGYWINVNTAGNLTVKGSPGGSRSASLVDGWNLIGYTSRETNSIVNIVQPVDYKTLWRWNATGDKWESYTAAIQFGDFSDMTPGRGYWINVNIAGNLEYPGV